MGRDGVSYKVKEIGLRERVAKGMTDRMLKYFTLLGMLPDPNNLDAMNEVGHVQNMEGGRSQKL